ncbi:hypothetical protein [Nonomuraea candida]|uniref:hypothetical protein n=1 Tax=Nonomuraea candida TaxID=359159 RepID=UPI0005B7D64A|nr:hypothetical protein [Nonomuraea candida]
MADHDRDAGSRGEEEAPRDPTPGQPAPTGPTTELPHPPATDEPHLPAAAEPPHPAAAEEPGGLKYGEQADRSYAYIPPTTSEPVPETRASAFGAFLRRRRTQVLGAGAIGLAVGGLLGGATVAALYDLARESGARHEMWRGPGWVPPHMEHWGRGSLCHPPRDEDTYCVLLPPRVERPAPGPAADPFEQEETIPDPADAD